MTNKELKTKVYEAIGAASMCWKPIPEGVFDSSNAERIGDELLAYITSLTAPPDEERKGVLIDKVNKSIDAVEFAGHNWVLLETADVKQLIASQPLPMVTDEEIIKEAGNIIAWKHREIIQDYFKIGAKWMRSKLTGK